MSQYQLCEKIGEGGMGVVYRARQVDLGRDVAIKLLRPKDGPPDRSTVHRFRHEMEILIGLRHPNIVRVLDAGSLHGQLCLVMELLEADDLATLLQRRCSFTLSMAFSILHQLLDALSYLHSQGIIHRDIKPSNVMIDGTNRVILTDFGLARGIEQTALTRSDEIIGTPRYMPPETLSGCQHTFASDLWGVGVTAYELLSGEAAFPQTGVGDVLKAIQNQDLPLLSTRRAGVPIEVTAFVHRFLEANPCHRWGSVDEAREALARICEPPAPAQPTGPRESLSRPRRSSPRVPPVWPVLGLVALIVGAGLMWHADTPQGSRPGRSPGGEPGRPSIAAAVRPSPSLNDRVSRLENAVKQARLVVDRSTDPVFHQVISRLRGWDRGMMGAQLRLLLAQQPGALAPYETFARQIDPSGELRASFDGVRDCVTPILQQASSSPATLRRLLSALWPLDQIDGLASILGRPPLFDVEGALRPAFERQVYHAAPDGPWRTVPDGNGPAMMLVAHDDFEGNVAGHALAGAYSLDGNDRVRFREDSRLEFADRSPEGVRGRQLAFRVTFFGALSYLRLTSPDTGVSLPIRTPNGYTESVRNKKWIVVTLKPPFAASARWTLEHYRISRDTWRAYVIVEEICSRRLD